MCFSCRDSRITDVSTNEARTKLMNRTAQEVQTRWLESRQPEDLTGNGAEKFSDECWENGLRLDN